MPSFLFALAVCGLFLFPAGKIVATPDSTNRRQETANFGYSIGFHFIIPDTVVHGFEFGVLEKIRSYDNSGIYFDRRYSIEFFKLNNKQLGAAAKFGYQYIYFPFMLRGSGGLYTNFDKKYSFVLLPEIGIAPLEEIILIGAGWHIPVIGNPVIGSTFRVSLTVNYYP